MKIFYLCILCFFLITSCRKLIKVDEPSTELTTGNIFSNPDAIESAILNVYTILNSVDANFIPYVGLYVDELNKPTPNSISPEYLSGSLLPTNTASQNVWRNLYSAIYSANAIVEGIISNGFESNIVGKHALGEAKFIRAYCHWMLLNIYGDIPLITQTDVRFTSIAERINYKQVYSQVIEDLNKAQELLSKEYKNNEKTRVNYWAATALLARAYLFTNQWQKAESESSKIISSGFFTPLPSLSNVFLKNNKEAIWQIWNQNGFSIVGSQFIPSSGVPAFSLAPSLINAFDSADKRKQAWTRSVTVGGTNYVHPFKYQKRTTTTGTAAEYTVYLRAAEQYLIRSEARVHLNNIDGALADLNVIRNRADLPDLFITNADTILLAIANERRTELFAEGGHRFFDLKRTGTINEIMSLIKPLWKPKAALYPIPQNEIINNPRLIQNPGY